MIRVGVFGTGSLGRHHVRIYHELPETELVGIYDINRETSTHLAEKYNTRAFETLEELADQVQAASVVVPTDKHRYVAGQLLEKGIHLLIEKPISSTTEEAEELVQLAQSKNLILQVGHVERFNPVLTYLDKLTSVPRFIEAHRLAPYPPQREGLPPRGTEVSVVLDLMIHDLEVLLHLVDSEITSVHAVGVPVLSSSEDISNVRLAFENGCVANITASRISPEPMRKIRVFFEDAYISLDYQAQTGEIHRKTEKGIEREAIPIKKGDALTNEISSFIHCVHSREQPKVSAGHASKALRLAVRIARESRT